MFLPSPCIVSEYFFRLPPAEIIIRQYVEICQEQYSLRKNSRDMTDMPTYCSTFQDSHVRVRNHQMMFKQKTTASGVNLWKRQLKKTQTVNSKTFHPLQTLQTTLRLAVRLSEGWKGIIRKCNPQNDETVVEHPVNVHLKKNRVGLVRDFCQSMAESVKLPTLKKKLSI